MVQWVRLPTPNAGGLGLTPVWGTRSRMHAATKSPRAATKRSHMPQRRSRLLQLRPNAAKINKLIKINLKKKSPSSPSLVGETVIQTVTYVIV